MVMQTGPSSPSPPPSTEQGIDKDITEAPEPSKDTNTPTDTLEREGVENCEPVENGREEPSLERENGEPVTPVAVETVEKQQTKEALLKVVPPPPPKQTSITSLFARQHMQQASRSPVNPSTDAAEPPPRKPKKTRLPLDSSSLPPAPKLSSVEEFVVVEKERTDENRDLTPLEMFQLRLMGQMTGAARQMGKKCDKGHGKREEEEGEGEKGDPVLKPLISDDVISKLKDRPGGH